MNKEHLPKVTWVSYLLLGLAILMFSGLFTRYTNGLQILDFAALNGKFGTIANNLNFTGTGGSGARGGFMFALTLTPAVILALGIIRVIEGYGGLLAAERLISPLFRPLLGIPGLCGLAFMSSMQNCDSGAGMTKDLYEQGFITNNERTIFCMLQMSSGGTITNYFSTMSVFFGVLLCPIGLPLLVIFLGKIFSANMMRLVVRLFPEKHSQATQENQS